MFFDNFVKLCVAKGETPTSVAVKLGIYRSAVTEWKNGAKPRDYAVQKIADYFGVSKQLLLDGFETTNEETSQKEKELHTLVATLTDAECEQLSDYINFLLSKRSKK